MFIYALVSVILLFMTLGLGIFFLLPIGLVLAIVWLWCTVQAAIAGFDGRQYRYPISFRIMS